MGPGKENVRASCPEIFACSPDAVISYGFSGSLSPGLKRGDVLIADKIQIADGENHIFQTSLKGADLFPENQFQTGTLLSAPELIPTAEGKKFLSRQFNAMAVDMEAGYLCEEVLKKKIKFYAIRGITDFINENIPAVIQYWAGPLGKMSGKKMFTDILKAPYIIPSLIRLGISSRKANRNLIRAFKIFSRVAMSAGRP